VVDEFNADGTEIDEVAALLADGAEADEKSEVDMKGKLVNV
jgi:hypothetical protein